jgi:uncharacterized membrane-anchored protein YitT (DUF2179 family)
MRGKAVKYIKEYFMITFGAVVAAAAIYFFMLPSHVAIGSGSALAMVLANFIPLPVSVISLSLNIIFLIMGFILVGPEFGVKTVYTTILVPVSLGVFEIFFPNFQSLTEDPLLDMICYLLIVGIAMAILFSYNASSGGLDIVAKIMNKHLKMELGTAISVSGLAVALTTVFAYDTKIVVLSLLGTYMSGIVVDKFIFGLNIKRRVCILSQEHTQEIVDYILHELHSGASLYDVIGAYDGVVRREILTIVDKNEYRKLMEFVKKTDPKAFVTVYSVNELRYQPKVK